MLSAQFYSDTRTLCVTERTIMREWLGAKNLLWREEDVFFYCATEGEKANITCVPGLVTAVCRPESCADGHVCGVLDIGIIR